MSTSASTANDTVDLSGMNILVVEDDYFVAKEVASILREHGATVLGPVPDIARGRALLSSSTPDCAVLDIHLKSQFVFELAEELRERGVPPVFATGYDASFLPPSLRDLPILQKPVDAAALVRIVRDEVTMRRLPQ
jgi:DNA-binding LytR/AlgR family response regulator